MHFGSVSLSEKEKKRASERETERKTEWERAPCCKCWKLPESARSFSCKLLMLAIYILCCLYRDERKSVRVLTHESAKKKNIYKRNIVNETCSTPSTCSPRKARSETFGCVSFRAFGALFDRSHRSRSYVFLSIRLCYSLVFECDPRISNAED